MKYEYLLFNLIILILPSLGIFLYRGKWPRFSSAALAILSVSLFYIIWDQTVTGHWWNFNDKYTLGLKIGKLPIEEILFFLIIPWSCLGIWENLKDKVKSYWNIKIEYWILIITLITALTASLFNKWYTVTISGVIIATAIYSLITNSDWLRKKATSLFLAIVLTLTIVFNSYLTGRPIVTYNPAFISNIFIGTIPIEDILYGLTLVSAIVIMYEKLNNRKM